MANKKDLYIKAPNGQMISRLGFYGLVTAIFESAESAANLLRVLNHQNVSPPNWKGKFKSREDSIKKITSEIRSQFGNSKWVLMDGYFNARL
jgi:hypothetical protein